MDAVHSVHISMQYERCLCAVTELLVTVRLLEKRLSFSRSRIVWHPYWAWFGLAGSGERREGEIGEGREGESGEGI